MQPDAASPDNADDGGRARVGLDEIENLPREHRQHLRHQAETNLMQLAATRGANAFDLLAIGTLDCFREQFPECAEIRCRDRQHAGKRSKSNNVDPHQRPDQRVDAADRIQKPPHRETKEDRGNDVTRREQAERQR